MATAAKVRGEVLNYKPNCLTNAKDDEEVFILRAQDCFAPDLIEAWADKLEFQMLRDAVVKNVRVDMKTYNKIDGARIVAKKMREWQAANKSKVPD